MPWYVDAFVGQELALLNIGLFLETVLKSYSFCVKEYLVSADHKKFTANKIKVLKELRHLKG